VARTEDKEYDEYDGKISWKTITLEAELETVRYAKVDLTKMGYEDGG
jgi:hypothetical protein